VFIVVVYFVIDSVRKLLDTLSCVNIERVKKNTNNMAVEMIAVLHLVQ